jgi:hypothetical protein
MLKSFASFLPLLLASSAIAHQAPSASETALVLTHVTVIDATGAPANPDLTVIVAGNRIKAIGKSREIVPPRRARIVDATGKFLIPGLWDMHAHPSHARKEYLALFVANGVTGVRVMWGFPSHHEWRKAIEVGELLGPHMAIGSPIVDGPQPCWPGSIAVTDESHARRTVAQVKQDGADFVKIYQGLPRELYFAIADEAKKLGIAFEGHVPISVSAEEASNAGQKSFEHLIGILSSCSTHKDELLKGQQADLAEGIAAGKLELWGPHVRQSWQMRLDSYSSEKAAVLSALLKRNGTWQCPTLTVMHMLGYADDPAFFNDPRLKYLPAQEKVDWDPAKIDAKHGFAHFRREFQKDLEVVGTMQRVGVGILAGTDEGNPFCFPGFSLHDELFFLVQAGLTPMQALQAATLNPARFLGKERDFGTIEESKIADLVLLDGNPLEDIGNTRNIAAVVYGGRLFDRTALDQILSNVKALASR